MKKFGTYLLYVVGLLLLAYLCVKHLEEMRRISSSEFYPLPPIVWSSVYSIIIGAYIALPRLLFTLKATGRIQVDWLKLLIVGIPTKIKNSLYDAELVIQFSEGEIKRYNLLD